MADRAQVKLDLNAPLYWEHEDGLRRGTEVVEIPQLGEIFFSDAMGPVVRVKNVRQARWNVIIKIMLRTGNQHWFRVTCIERYDDTFVYAVPWVHPEVIHCTMKRDHDGCTPWICGRVHDRVEAIARVIG